MRILESQRDAAQTIAAMLFLAAGPRGCPLPHFHLLTTTLVITFRSAAKTTWLTIPAIPRRFSEVYQTSADCHAFALIH